MALLIYNINIRWHYVSVITLNVNELNLEVKRHRLSGWFKKIRPNYMLPLRDSL